MSQILLKIRLPFNFIIEVILKLSQSLQIPIEKLQKIISQNDDLMTGQMHFAFSQRVNADHFKQYSRSQKLGKVLLKLVKFADFEALKYTLLN